MKTSENKGFKPLLRAEDVAKLLNMKASRVRYEVFMQRIPYLKIGRSIRFRQGDIEKWLENYEMHR